MIHFNHTGPYFFGSTTLLTNQQKQRFADVFNTPFLPSESVLGGRNSIRSITIDEIGPLVIKRYRRGGILRHLMKQHYFKYGKTRCQVEFEYLVRVRTLGIEAPEPVLFSYKGCMLYQAWLVTKEIQHQQSLAELSQIDENRTKKVLAFLADQVSTLIQHKIYHVDLHPGNVLVDHLDSVYIIDFDKTRVFHGNENKLQAKYRNRWKRAVIKHRLPEMLNHFFQLK